MATLMENFKFSFNVLKRNQNRLMSLSQSFINDVQDIAIRKLVL